MTSKILDLIYKFKSNALKNYSILWCAFNPRLISNWPYIQRNGKKRAWKIYKSTFDHRSVKYIRMRHAVRLFLYAYQRTKTHLYWDFCWFLSSNSKMEGKPLSSSIANDTNIYFTTTIPLQTRVCSSSSSTENNSIICCMKLTHFDSQMHCAIKMLSFKWKMNRPFVYA